MRRNEKVCSMKQCSGWELWELGQQHLETRCVKGQAGQHVQLCVA